MFCRIQNLHISQTNIELTGGGLGFVEFKIYISLKLKLRFGEEILNLGIKKWTDTDPGPKAI